MSNRKGACRIGFNIAVIFQSPQHIEVCHRESIKKTIIKHEEVFKKQVNELHRLYKVQKNLMWEMRVKEMKNMRPLQLTSKAHNVENKDTTETSRSSYGSVRNTSESTPVHRCSAMAAVRIAHELSNYSEGPSKVSDGFNLRRLNDEGDSLDLTLSICRTSEKIRGEDWKKISEETTKLVPSDLSGGAESMKRHHWHLQALSLNKT